MLPQLVTIEPLPDAPTRRERENLGARLAIEAAFGHPHPIAHTPDGAPYLPDAPQVHISVSHSHDVLVMAFSLHGPIGVDVEYDSPRVATVVPRVMCEAEQGLPPLEVWCAKEAVFKCALIPGAVLSDIIVAPDLTGATLRGHTFTLKYLERGHRCIVLARREGPGGVLAV